MKPLRSLALCAMLALTQTTQATQAAPASCGDACMKLIKEGQALEGQGKHGDALEKYKAASRAAPQASLPLSAASVLYLVVADGMKPDKRKELREAAGGLARHAAKLDPADPLAQEALRLLEDDAPSPLRAASPQGEKLFLEARALFMQGDAPGALQRYEAVMRTDPQFSAAWVGAGDCYFMQKDWPRAEAMFRRAAEIEPRNAQAWRFLADALVAQGRRGAAEDALLSAIAADPAQRPSWSKLAALRAAGQAPLARLALRRGARVVEGKDGDFTVEFDGGAEEKDTPDTAIRLARAIAEVNLRRQDTARSKSPYEIELASWRMALRVIDEVKDKAVAQPGDPALLRLHALAQDGQLEAAILLLQFRQAYRPALEAWLAANPNGVRTFIERHALQP